MKEKQRKWAALAIAVGVIAVGLYVITDNGKPIDKIHYNRYVKVAKYDGLSYMQGEKKSEVAKNLLDLVIEESRIKKWPDHLLKEEIERADREEKDTAKSYDVDFDVYLDNFLGLTEKEYKKEIRDKAKTTLKDKLVVYAIARKEKVELSEEEYQKRLDKMFKSTGLTEKEFEKFYGMPTKEYAEYYDLYSNILGDKVGELIFSRATSVDGRK